MCLSSVLVAHLWFSWLPAGVFVKLKQMLIRIGDNTYLGFGHAVMGWMLVIMVCSMGA